MAKIYLKRVESDEKCHSLKTEEECFYHKASNRKHTCPRECIEPLGDWKMHCFVEVKRGN